MVDTNEFAGQVVIVTGGARGIGRAIALAFAARECSVVICYQSNHEAAAEVVRAASERGWHVSALQIDVTDRQAVDAMVAKVQDDFGSVDILVNNAGLFSSVPVVDMSDKDWDHIVSTNLTAVFYCCRAVLPAMIAAHRGAIVNIASIAGQRGSAYHAHYAAAKGGLLAFTRSLAREVIQYNVRVNAVTPGRIETDLLRTGQDEREYMRWMADTPAGRLGTTNEVAEAVVFLASSASSYIVGESLAVNGGLLMD
jgi:3-oxoacyl-[acyl-carrier protein] reductase